MLMHFLKKIPDLADVIKGERDLFRSSIRLTHILPVIINLIFFLTLSITFKICMNKPHSDQIIVFISGSFLNTSYWDLWKTYFEQGRHIAVYVPEFARLLPSTSITYSKNRKSIDLKYLLDESINFIKRLPDKPILIGHLPWRSSCSTTSTARPRKSGCGITFFFAKRRGDFEICLFYIFLEISESF